MHLPFMVPQNVQARLQEALGGGAAPKAYGHGATDCGENRG